MHHIYGLNLIVKEAIEILGLEIKENESDYTQEEIVAFVKLVKELHNKYPPGVCLTRKVHKLYHYYEGMNDSTPEKWQDFLNQIASGEIIIPN